MTITEGKEKETSPLLANNNSERKVSFHDDVRSEKREYMKAFSYLQQWTESERLRALSRQGVGPAAFLICDAILGYTEDPAEGSFDPYHESCSPLKSYISIQCRRWVTTRFFLWFVQLVSWILVILSFVEPPTWCRNHTNSSHNAHGCIEILDLHGPPADDPTPSTDVYYYPSTRTVFVTVKQSLIISWVCVTILLVFILLRLGRDGMSLKCYLRPGPRQFVRSLQLIAILALFCGLSISSHFQNRRPLSFFLRIVIAVCATRSTQKELLTIVRLIPEVIDILALLFLVILFYAWVGVMGFYLSPEGAEHFPTLIEGLWSLWICVTTANYPDVMMPGYNKSRWVALYFVSFMIITFFFFMNVILASVVNSYENQKEARDKKRTDAASADLKRAFALMDPDNTGAIARETVMALFLVLNDDFPQIPIIPDDEAKILFAILDKDGSNKIDENEFMEFADVMLLEFERTGSYVTFVEKMLPKLYRWHGYKRFRRFVQSEKFEFAIDVILVFNAIVVAIQSYPLLVGESVEVDPSVFDGEIDTPWEGIETAFTIIYCVEMGCKILVLGFHKFAKSYRNLFDLIITIIAVLATAYVYYPNEFSDSRLIRLVVMARVLRLSRLLVAIKKFQVIGKTCIDILPACSRVFVVLFCIMYVFAALGMQLYGGMITRDPSNPLSYHLLGTDFSENDYWANNFNDMLSGMNVLFNLLVVNNWTECEIGFEAVTQSRYPRLFFLGFHIIGVIVVNNVVVAVVINAFITQWDVQYEIQHDQQGIDVVPGEAIIGERRALFDAREVTGTKTDISGRYVATVRKSRLGGQQKLLRGLFTRTSTDLSKGNSSKGNSSENGQNIM